MPRATEEDELHHHKLLKEKIARVFDGTRTSHATHTRKLKELFTLFLSSASPGKFFTAFSETLAPLFDFSRRTASAERIIKFVAAFATFRSEKNINALEIDEFLERFLRFLLVASTAANKTSRHRACQIISEIIMRLPDDTEVSNELWDEVIEHMKLRVNDKVPAVRTFAVRALSRFLSDSENSDILELFVDKLPSEQNPDVRKTIVLSLPPSNATLAAIIDCALDVSESVRKAVYCVLASKFPLQSLSIKLRTTILQRGLADRSAAVVKECLNLIKDDWLPKFCNGDPVELLKYLDVETYEEVGESVICAILKEGLVNLEDVKSLHEFSTSDGETTGGPLKHDIQLMEPEVALYWRIVCKHLQMEAQVKGSDAAMTMGAESAVYAAEASDSNDLLDRVLTASVSEYVELVKAHLTAGSNYRFASRQLLLLGEMFDFSDATNRKVAGELVQELLHKPLDHEKDENDNDIVIGDGINLGGDKDWASAVSKFVRQVHAALGEFEEVVLTVVAELVQPCRERTADYKEWLHCLAVTGLLLESARSYHLLQGKAIEPAEILHSLLLPGAKHAHFDVQRAAIRCLGLFGLLERKPCEDLVKQLRFSFIKGPSSITIMSSKAMLDLGLWHGPHEVDKAMNQDVTSQFKDQKVDFSSINWCDASENLHIGMLDMLYWVMERNCISDFVESDEIEFVQAVLAEGFAKILLLSEKYPNADASSHPLLLGKLIGLFFSSDSKDHLRLKQCLSVFFDHYPSLSANHKKCLSKAFIPVTRSLWPGIMDSAKRSSAMVAMMRKRAVQAARFMVQMMQAPLYTKDNVPKDGDGSEDTKDVFLEFDSGEEGLAIRIAAEVMGFPSNKTAAEKSYVSALCRILVLLHFRSSEQGPIKLMRQLLSCIAQSVVAERELLKELKEMASRLKAADRSPDQQLSSDQANHIFGRLELEVNLDEVESVELPPTPAPRSIRTARARRRPKAEEESSSDGELSPTSVVPADSSNMRARSQRASKTAAMTRMTTNNTSSINEEEAEDDDSQEDSGSEVTSADDSDAF
ncbi:condensin complex subunit 3 isoform X1 [Coffea eugenioides]|uniref:condensin complex subunit 3 isoform X1 n=1 Tax=Coffea eugenioides TaxID=49369 RepID=UPI000F60C8AE|nr:condensin complex subunit 3 isoform X1 [Coffea eugenioides]